MSIFDKLRTHRWNVFNAELMHSKGNGIKDTHYIHDILVWDGELLLGSTYQERYDILQSMLQVEGETKSHYIIDNHTWLARNHSQEFSELFKGCEAHEEGLVLKNPLGEFSLSDNNGWTVKCRKPTKNFGF